MEFSAPGPYARFRRVKWILFLLLPLLWLAPQIIRQKPPSVTDRTLGDIQWALAHHWYRNGKFPDTWPRSPYAANNSQVIRDLEDDEFKLLSEGGGPGQYKSFKRDDVRVLGRYNTNLLDGFGQPINVILGTNGQIQLGKRLIKAEFVLYSFGPNRTDDKGLKDDLCRIITKADLHEWHEELRRANKQLPIINGN